MIPALIIVVALVSFMLGVAVTLEFTTERFFK
jgi:hypothetical protein